MCASSQTDDDATRIPKDLDRLPEAVTVDRDPNTGALTIENDPCPPSSICTYGGSAAYEAVCGTQPTCPLQGTCAGDPTSTLATCYP